ncbi:hypothetical protein DXG01_014042 [Tephrocybe rancida]|nr:hypothetical protein DXG01_014042 [Tephrocybe rancida]
MGFLGGEMPALQVGMCWERREATRNHEQPVRLVQRTSADTFLTAIYDRTEACDPDTRRYIIAEPGWDAMQAYVVRVIPLASNTTYAQLPPHDLARIAEFFVMPKLKGWRKALLNCALISKAWVHVVDIYFQSLGDVCRYVPSVLAVARSLEMWSYRGGLMRHLSVYDYRHKNIEYLGSCLPREWRLNDLGARHFLRGWPSSSFPCAFPAPLQAIYWPDCLRSMA